ncbi:ESX-1 associated ATP-binding protein EpsI N-terminal domain-containing protein, partial [Mycolicibacterium litorale]|uniref:ESX-1 associated ATP-binding protein EpsI N-terminal domain-containing protein n=1 Tax=Mycolicibacterium litorale TaxID=758802 RepID=UPI003CF5158A
MSADYDRLFHSPDAAQTPDEATVHVDRDALMQGNTAAPAPAGGTNRAESVAPPPLPITPPRTQAAPAGAGAAVFPCIR